MQQANFKQNTMHPFRAWASALVTQMYTLYSRVCIPKIFRQNICVSFLTWLRFSSKRMAKCKLQAHSANFTIHFKKMFSKYLVSFGINIIYLNAGMKWNEWMRNSKRDSEGKGMIARKYGENCDQEYIVCGLSGCQILQALIFKWKWSLYYSVKWRESTAFTLYRIHTERMKITRTNECDCGMYFFVDMLCSSNNMFVGIL